MSRVKAAPRAAGRPSTPPGGYIPLSETPPPERLGEEVPVEEGESVEDSLLRRTREFNELTRTRPQELQGWLDFAAFQDELVKVGRKREAVQALDKKLAIHEKVRLQHSWSSILDLSVIICEGCLESIWHSMRDQGFQPVVRLQKISTMK